jgi:hypothetical protein
MNLHKENAQGRPTNKMLYTAVQNTQNVNSFFSLLLQTIHITHWQQQQHVITKYLSTDKMLKVLATHMVHFIQCRFYNHK